MADNEFAGSALYATWVHPGGTVLIHTEFRNWTVNDSGTKLDATAGADTYVREIGHLDAISVSTSFLVQSDMGTVTNAAFARNTAGTLTWGEAGTVAGRPKTILPARVDAATRNQPYNDVVSYDVTFTQNGSISRTAY